MICGAPGSGIRGYDTIARRRGQLALALGVLVQDPSTGMWFDDGTGTPVDLPAPPPDTSVSLQTAGSQPSDWLSSLVGALPKVSAFMTAEQLAQVNVKRAQAGQPPLQTSQYAPQVGVGLDSQTKSFLTMGGIGLAAVIVLSKLRGRKR